MNEAQDVPKGEESPKYWAFISYSHRDAVAAAWLHRALERYALPRRLVGSATRVGTVPRRLFPVFRDKDELPSAANLPSQIQDALRASRNLIVVCSPHAVASKWVDQEVRYFKQLGRSQRVFCLLIDGEPGASDSPEGGLAEAFPKAVRFELSPHGELSTDRAEPLAADLRPAKQARRPVLLRLVAGMLGLDYDALVMRDARARLWRWIQVGALAGTLLVIGGAAWLEQYRAATREHDIAELRQLTQVARGLVDAREGDLVSGVLLGIEALRRADALGQSPETALKVVRDGASLLPGRTGWRLDPPAADPGAVAFSADGRWVCAANGSNGIDVWVTSTGQRFDALAKAPTRDAICLGRPVAGKPAAAPAAGSQGAAAFSNDGRWMAMVEGPAEPVKLVDARSGATVRELKSEQLVDRIQFTPDGTRVIGHGAGMSNVGAQDSGLVVWERETGRIVSHRAFATYIDAVATAPATRLVAAASGSTLRIIDSDSGGLVQTIPTTAGLSGDAKTSLALSLEGRWVAFGDGRDVRIWHVPTAALVARIQGVGKVNAFSPNGRFLLTGDAAMWSMNSAAQVNARLSEQETAQAPVIAQRKAVLAHGSRIGPILLWDLELGDVVKRLDEQVWSRVVAIDPSARVLVAMNGTTLGSMQSARIWDIESQKKRGELSPGGSIELGAVSNDARLVALLVEGRGALVFDAQTLKELGSFGAPSTVDAMSFNAEGNRLILRAKGTDTPLDIGSLARPQPAAQRGGSPRDTAPWALSITGDTEAQSLAVRNTKTGAPVQTLATGVVEYALSGDGRRLVTLGRSGQFASMWVYPDDLVADGCARAGRELSDADRKTYLGGKAGIDPCRNSR